MNSRQLYKCEIIKDYGDFKIGQIYDVNALHLTSGKITLKTNKNIGGNSITREYGRLKQFTGLYDYNNNQLFEYDKVRYQNNIDIIIWIDGSYILEKNEIIVNSKISKRLSVVY